MAQEPLTTVKALTPGELAAQYNVSTKTLLSWVKKHEQAVGERFSRYFTVRQVRIIYDCIGSPSGVYIEK